MLSALTLLPYIVIGFLLSQSNISKAIAGASLATIAILMNAVRCPLTTLITFTAKKRADKATKFRLRLRRQKKEIEDAKKEREFMRSTRVTESSIADKY